MLKLCHRRSQDFFEWGGGGGKSQITCIDVIRNFQTRNFLWDKDIESVRSEGEAWFRHLIRILLKEKGLNPKLNSKNVQHGKRVE